MLATQRVIETDKIGNSEKIKQHRLNAYLTVARQTHDLQTYIDIAIILKTIFPYGW